MIGSLKRVLAIYYLEDNAMNIGLKWKHAKAMGRVCVFSLLNGYKYDKDNILYPYVNTRTLMNIFLQGERSISSFEIIQKQCLSEDKTRLIFNEISIPIPDNEHEILHGLLIEIGDIILPYLFSNDFRIINGTTVEGPYEIPGKFELAKGDVVIDAGANIGLFSAVAAAKGCNVYSFEPIKPVIDKYLSYTAQWNNSIPGGGTIRVINKALSNVTGTAEFLYDETMVGSSAMKGIRKQTDMGCQSIIAESITLDDFVRQQKLKKVDFIKADIEGAERNLLWGATEVMREFAPKIAVRTYHLPDDSKVLRQIIQKGNPRYKIFEKYKTMYAYV